MYATTLVIMTIVASIFCFYHLLHALTEDVHGDWIRCMGKRKYKHRLDSVHKSSPGICAMVKLVFLKIIYQNDLFCLKTFLMASFRLMICPSHGEKSWTKLLVSSWRPWDVAIDVEVKVFNNFRVIVSPPWWYTCGQTHRPQTSETFQSKQLYQSRSLLINFL